MVEALKAQTMLYPLTCPFIWEFFGLEVRLQHMPPHTWRKIFHLNLMSGWDSSMWPLVMGFDTMSGNQLNQKLKPMVENIPFEMRGEWELYPLATFRDIGFWRLMSILMHAGVDFVVYTFPIILLAIIGLLYLYFQSRSLSKR